jgi:hypothetical protein
VTSCCVKLISRLETSVETSHRLACCITSHIAFCYLVANRICIPSEDHTVTVCAALHQGIQFFSPTRLKHARNVEIRVRMNLLCVASCHGPHREHAEVLLSDFYLVRLPTVQVKSKCCGCVLCVSRVPVQNLCLAVRVYRE